VHDRAENPILQPPEDFGKGRGARESNL
jgi:hypothetical protein